MLDNAHILEYVFQMWMNLENGWKAIYLSFFLLLIVLFGVPIPW